MRSFSWCVPVLALALATTAVAAEKDSKKGKAPIDVAHESAWAHIELEGTYHEGAQLPGLFGEMSESLATAVGRIEKAADDATVSGVILRINGPHIAWGKMAAFREAIQRVQAKGKKVYAWLDSGSNMDYLLAAACDEVVMPESATLMLVGLRAEVTFYKTLLDWLGVKAEMLRVGEFKSAGEPYTRTEMSPEFRKEMEEILDDYYRQMLEVLTKSRKLTDDEAKGAIDAGPHTAAQAKTLKLIDRIAYEDELESALEKQVEGKKLRVLKKYGKKKIDTDFSGFGGMMKFMEMIMGVEPPQKKSITPKIAVIYATGPIMSGKSSTDLFSSESTIGSDTMIKAIRDARNNDQVKAIVLRINSPGGSALASDLIWRELELVKKPFVVSMGDVAASGGYYIAQGADKIFAEPGTLTGSIGVVGGKLSLAGLYKKIGITTSVISRGKNSGIFSSNEFTDSERETMQKLLNDIYDQFTSKAAAGRKMEKEKLEKLARGRVYTGAMAKKLGLVDELGSLDDAVAAAQKLAGLNEGEKIERLNLPKPVSPLEQFIGPLDPNAEARAREAATLGQALRGLSPELDENLRELSVLSRLAREPALLVLPFRMTVR